MSIQRFFQRSALTRTLWTFRHEFWIVAGFSLVANLLMLTPTIYMLQIYDRVMASRSELTLLAVSLITLFLMCMLAFCEWTRSRILVRGGVRLDRMLSTRVFNASFESYLSQSVAGPSRAFQDLLTVRQFITGPGIFGFLDAPWMPIYIAVIFMLHPYIGVATLCFAAFQGLLAWLGHRRTVAPAKEASQAQSEVNLYLQAKLRNAEVVESMGMLDDLRRRWRKLQDTYLRSATTSQDINSRVMAWSKFVRYSQQSLTLGLGALLVIKGELTPGSMIAANVLMSRALSPIDSLVGVWRQMAITRDAFVRLEALLEEFPERDPGLKRVPPQGEVTLRDVFATAEGRSEPILKNVGFHVPAGTITAVMGPSGSGKSTLARVLVGIWPNVAGEVLLDGMPLSGWNRIELGPHVGYLPQDIELLEGTIAENIARFGEVDSDSVIEAAKTTGLHEMILRFPKGYDTPIGEAGRLLSGGQRQRIGLARAVYRMPPLVVLDEPNANLDDAGEQALVRALQQLKAAGKTVFIVTHRPGSVATADRVLVLRNGFLQHDGTPAEVLAQLRPAVRNEPPTPALGDAQPA